MARLADSLSTVLGTRVEDKTGMAGEFDVKLGWTPDGRESLLMRKPGAAAPPTEEAATSIFTAIQEQLGLKLEARKAAVEGLVVERAERPAEN
jgi:uncharacterized protein (TIGR03435 family)